MSPTLSTKEVCEILGCKRRRVFQLLKEGKLDRVPRVGRSLRIFRMSLDRVLYPTKKSRKKAAARGEIVPARLENLPPRRTK